MDYPTNDHFSQICNRHKKPIVDYDEVNNKPDCLTCLLEKPGMVSSEKYQQKLKEIINKEKQNYLNDMQVCQSTYNSMLKYKTNVIWSLDKILQIILDQMKIIESHQQKFEQSIGQQLQKRTIEDLEKQSQQHQLENEQFKNLIKQQLDVFKKKYVSSEQLFPDIYAKPKIVIREQILDQKKAEFEIIQQSNRKQNHQCSAFAFKKDNNILVVGCVEEIIVYQFLNGMIAEEWQRLADHTEEVSCLYFMKQSNSFVSGSEDKQIIIWEFDKKQNKWYAKQKLQEQINQVDFIVMNAKEDLIISGNLNQTIKFWRKINNRWICKQEIDKKNNDVAINKMQDELTSCGIQNFVSVVEKGIDDQWRIIQNINVSWYGVRLRFRVGDQYVFRSESSDQLEKQQQNERSQYFPYHYIKQLKVIQVKNDYQLIKSIEFQSDYLFGTLSDDGQYLVTQDYGSKEIQVRKLRFLQ